MTSKNIWQFKRFISGSEAGIYTFEHNKNNIDNILDVSEKYGVYSPISVLVKSMQRKLTKQIKNAEIAPLASSARVAGFNRVYKSSAFNLDKVDFRDADYLCLAPLEHDINITFNINGEPFVQEVSKCSLIIWEHSDELGLDLSEDDIINNSFLTAALYK